MGAQRAANGGVRFEGRLRGCTARACPLCMGITQRLAAGRGSQRVGGGQAAGFCAGVVRGPCVLFRPAAVLRWRALAPPRQSEVLQWDGAPCSACLEPRGLPLTGGGERQQQEQESALHACRMRRRAGRGRRNRVRSARVEGALCMRPGRLALTHRALTSALVVGCAGPPAHPARHLPHFAGYPPSALF